MTYSLGTFAAPPPRADISLNYKIYVYVTNLRSEFEI